MSDGFDIEFNLNVEDFMAFQANPNLATSENDTFLVATATTAFITSSFSLPINARSSSNSFQATDYVADASRPSIVDFTLDLNTGTVILTFSEVVDTSTLDVSQITLQDTEDGSQFLLNHCLHSDQSTGGDHSRADI